MEEPQKLTLTVEECASRLGIGRSLAWSLVARGEIPSVRFGRLRRVPTVSLEQWLSRQADASQFSDR